MTRALVVVAHPDDETLFFGGLVLSAPEVAWHVVCVTDGGHGGRGARRRAESAALYGLLAHGVPVPPGAVRLHAPLLPFIEAGAVARSARGFFAAYMAA